MANYDKIAPYYDKLSRAVFFKSQVNAQVNQLKHIPANSSVLIVGGGTGWILEEIGKVHQSGLTITYLEISEQMLKLSKERNSKNNQVNFEHASVEDYVFTIQYDVIMTPFLFDNFSAKQIEIVFNKLNTSLKSSGKWFFVDFVLEGKGGDWWKSILLKAMYLFFKILRIVKTSKLIDLSPYFIKDFEKENEQYYYACFIKATIYSKKYFFLE